MFYRIINHEKYGDVLIQKVSRDEKPTLVIQFELTDGLTALTEAKFVHEEVRDRVFQSIDETKINAMFASVMEEFEKLEEGTRDDG